MNQTISYKYIGHATTLININTTKLLTDPNFSKRLKFFFKRHSPINSILDKLNDINVILLSDTSFDHLDISSYKYISRHIPIIVPEKCNTKLTKFLSNPIIELSSFATHTLPCGTKITAIAKPEQAGIISNIFSRKSNSYIIQKNNLNVFYSADSNYSDLFKETGKISNIDLAIIPISGYSPKCLMQNLHLNPEQAIFAFKDLNAKHMTPLRWGTFSLSLEALSEPIKKLEQVIEQEPLIKDNVHIVPHGESIVLNFD